jgi:hypothetical protein
VRYGDIEAVLLYAQWYLIFYSGRKSTVLWTELSYVTLNSSFLVEFEHTDLFTVYRRPPDYPPSSPVEHTGRVQKVSRCPFARIRFVEFDEAFIELIHAFSKIHYRSLVVATTSMDCWYRTESDCMLLLIVPLPIYVASCPDPSIPCS